jgi:hypothetical protein
LGFIYNVTVSTPLKGIISLEVPYVNKIVALNQTDLEVLKESLISLKTK